VSEPLKLRARLQSPVADVYGALTDPGALRSWLAEYAEVVLPHRYEFWGRYTPEGQAPHQRLLHADDRTLRLAWLLGGEETAVEICLEAESAEATILSLSQSHFDFQDAVSGNNILGVLFTYWSLSIKNLVDYLEGRQHTPKCDFTSTDMREQILIDALPQAVFDSLTNQEKFSQWFGYPIEIDPRVGGRWAMGTADIGYGPVGSILELDPERKLTMAEEGGGTVSWQLENIDRKTGLTFVEDSTGMERSAYPGWCAWLSAITELRRFNELADWRPVWLDSAATAGSDSLTD
jgi:uncharacterized protein YndB with AHSA1/START domain